MNTISTHFFFTFPLSYGRICSFIKMHIYNVELITSLKYDFCMAFRYLRSLYEKKISHIFTLCATFTRGNYLMYRYLFPIVLKTPRIHITYKCTFFTIDTHLGLPLLSVHQSKIRANILNSLPPP